MGWQDLLHFGVKLAGALETAHRRGLLHRDVKPGNILLTEYGEPQLADFGIARLAGGFETASGTVTGSPAYTAPEVLQGQAPDVTADVYGLAATLFCAGTGHAVFERRSGEQLVAQFVRITKQPMPDLAGSGLPPELTAVIESAMARDRGDRPKSAAEFGSALREIQLRHGLPPDEMAIPLPARETDGVVTGSGVVTGPGRVTPSGVAASPSGRRRTRGTTATPPVPATRLRPPTLTRALVERPRLLDALRSASHRRLAVIHGPTGFGKTTLAAQWCAAVTAAGGSVAWLTVDSDDDNVDGPPRIRPPPPRTPQGPPPAHRLPGRHRPHRRRQIPARHRHRPMRRIRFDPLHPRRRPPRGSHPRRPPCRPAIRPLAPRMARCPRRLPPIPRRRPHHLSRDGGNARERWARTPRRPWPPGSAAPIRLRRRAERHWAARAWGQARPRADASCLVRRRAVLFADGSTVRGTGAGRARLE
ncbi:conserved hypothetical protein [Nocardia seriolae]|nr:conserved hypothetical protein [Nocardia seriolae]